MTAALYSFAAVAEASELRDELGSMDVQSWLVSIGFAGCPIVLFRRRGFAFSLKESRTPWSFVLGETP